MNPPTREFLPSTGEDQYISGNISPRPSNSFNPDLPPLLALSASGEPPAKRQRVNHPPSAAIPAQRLGGPSPSPASPPPLGLPPPLTRHVGTQVGARVAHLHQGDALDPPPLLCALSSAGIPPPTSSGADGKIPLPPPSSSTHEDEKGVLCRGSAIDPDIKVTIYDDGYEAINKTHNLRVLYRSDKKNPTKWILHMERKCPFVHEWRGCSGYGIPPEGKIYPNLDEVIAFINEVFY